MRPLRLRCRDCALRAPRRFDGLAGVLAIAASLWGAGLAVGAEAVTAVSVTTDEDAAGRVLLRLSTRASALTVETLGDEAPRSRSGRRYRRIELGESRIAAGVGAPELPVVHRLVGVDARLDYELVVRASDPVVVEGVDLAPRQPDRMDGVGGRGAEPLVVDERRYGEDVELGNVPGQVLGRARLGGLSVVTLGLSPVRYNPAHHRVTIWQTIAVELRPRAWRGGLDSHKKAAPLVLSQFQRTQIQQLVVNAEAWQGRLQAAALDHVLVLTTPDLAPQARAFAARVSVATTTVYEIQEVPRGIASEALRTVVQERYRVGGLDSVLLFGDESRLPLHDWSPGLPGDSYYAMVDGDDAYADVGIGRLPVTDAATAEVVIAKNERYRRLQAGGLVNKNVLLVAHQEGYPGKYAANQEAIRNAANPRGLVFATQYGGRGADTSSLVSGLSAGAGYALVDYRGHGTAEAWPGWAADGGSFAAAEIARLDNRDEKLAIVWDIACDNGALQGDNPSLAERWLLHHRGDDGAYGAVAVLAATVVVATTTNDRYNQQLFGYLQTSPDLRLGSLVALANNRMVRDNGGNAVNNAMSYVLFGDPTLAPWIAGP